MLARMVQALAECVRVRLQSHSPGPCFCSSSIQTHVFCTWSFHKQPVLGHILVAMDYNCCISCSSYTRFRGGCGDKADLCSVHNRYFEKLDYSGTRHYGVTALFQKPCSSGKCVIIRSSLIVSVPKSESGQGHKANGRQKAHHCQLLPIVVSGLSAYSQTKDIWSIQTGIVLTNGFLEVLASNVASGAPVVSRRGKRSTVGMQRPPRRKVPAR